MKTCYHLIRLFLCLGFALLFSCCSSDEFTLTEENNTLVQRQNIANSYEQTGILYSQIYHEYQLIHSDSSYSINRIITEVEKIIALSTIYNESMEAYSSIDNAVIQDIIFNHSNILENYIENSALSPIAQQLFIGVIASLDNTSHNEQLDTLIDFEHHVMKDSLLTSLDQKILLNSSSIMRHSLDNGDDTDWDNSGDTILKATLIGMKENTSKAIVMAVVVQVFIRQQTEDKVPDEMSP